MSGKIAVDKLKPHPKNGYYFTDVTGEKYEEIKRSIATYGIRDPLKVTTSYTVVSGHQRLRIAKELGFTEIPVEIVDVDEWEAEYLLIAENVERRGQAETDPIKKARIAQFLKEYWGVQRGNNQHNRKGQNGLSKIADTIDESMTSTKRLLKLNALIPEIQSLVSSGKLGTTAAEQLAYLSEEEQRALFEARGDNVADITVAEAKDLRQQLAEKQAEIARLQNDLDKVRKERDKPPKIIEKEVVPPGVQRKLKEIERERDELDAALSKTYARLRDLERLEKSVQHQTQSPLYDMYRSLVSLEGYLQVFTEDSRLSGDLVANADKAVINKLKSVLRRVITHSQHAMDIIENEDVTIIDIQ